MHIESALIEKVGDAGRKLHTARSRNDQVSTDLKLFVRGACDAVDELLADVQRAFVSRCERDLDVLIPGYTHLQRAMPVSAAHSWLCWDEKLQRDRTRLQDCRARLNECPLGAAALAGTSLPIDRDRTASLLGFDRPAANSLDVSSDRDFPGGIPVLPVARRRPPVAVGGGVGRLVQHGVRLFDAAGRVHHGVQHHAPKAEPGRARTDPRPHRPGGGGAGERPDPY